MERGGVGNEGDRKMGVGIWCLKCWIFVCENKEIVYGIVYGHKKAGQNGPLFFMQ